MTTAGGPIEVRRHEEITVLRMRHGKANALDVAFCEALADGFEQEAASTSLGVVLTGDGSIFSAGVDLKQLLDGGPAYVRRLLPALARALEALFNHPKPVVAAINGHAIAGGCILACASDRRLMPPLAGRIGVPELRVGVPFPPLALEIMRYAVPARHLADMVIGGATFDPPTAKDLGLIDEIVEPDDLQPRALAEVGALAQPGLGTFGVTKAQLRRPALDRAREGERIFGAAIERLWTSPGSRAAIRDYVERNLKGDGR